MTEQLHANESTQPPAAMPPEDPWEARLRKQDELIATLSGLEGEELETTLAAHYQSVVDESLANGAGTKEVEAALLAESADISYSRPDIPLTFGEDGEPLPPEQIAEFRPYERHAFIDKVNDYGLRRKIVDANKYRIAHVETAVDFNAGQIKREWFSYQDVLETDEQKQAALEFTEHSESADNYARAMAREIVKGNSQDIEDAKLRIKYIFKGTVNKLPEDVRAQLSPFAGSESWVYWDIAKQKYLADNPPANNQEYRERANYVEHDPLEREGERFSQNAEWLHKTIAWRHLGWEAHQMAKNGVNMDWLKNFPEAAQYLLAPTKEDGKLHSWQYTELGRVVARAADSYDYVRRQAN